MCTQVLHASIATCLPREPQDRLAGGHCALAAPPPKAGPSQGPELVGLQVIASPPTQQEFEEQQRGSCEDDCDFGDLKTLHIPSTPTVNLSP